MLTYLVLALNQYQVYKLK